MLPNTSKGSPESLFIRIAALVVSSTIPVEQGAYFARCTVDELLGYMDDPTIAFAVDAEVTRMQQSGELAGLKAAKLTDIMLDKLLATPNEEISTSLAMKLAELGLKFREKATSNDKPATPNARVIVLKDGDPDPVPNHDGGFVLTIDLRNKLKATHPIDHEDISDAE